MIVVLAAGGTAPRFELDRPHELDRFHLEIRGDAAADLEEALCECGLGWVEGEHAWIEREGLRALAGADCGESWDAGLEAMFAYAAGKGWTRGGAIRAHVEPGPGP